MRLFFMQFVEDLLWFVSYWADRSQESAGDYSYTEVRDRRSGSLLRTKDHMPTGAVFTVLMLVFVPLIVGEAALAFLINPVLISIGIREIPFGSGVPSLLITSVGAGLVWYVGRAVYLVGIRPRTKSAGYVRLYTLEQALVPDKISLFLVSRVPAFVLAPWLCLVGIALVLYGIFWMLF